MFFHSRQVIFDLEGKLLMNKLKLQTSIFVLTAFLLGCNEFMIVGIISDLAQSIIFARPAGYTVWDRLCGDNTGFDGLDQSLATVPCLNVADGNFLYWQYVNGNGAQLVLAVCLACDYGCSCWDNYFISFGVR